MRKRGYATGSPDRAKIQAAAGSGTEFIAGYGVPSVVGEKLIRGNSLAANGCNQYIQLLGDGMPPSNRRDTANDAYQNPISIRREGLVAAMPQYSIARKARGAITLTGAFAVDSPPARRHSPRHGCWKGGDS